ncbi:MAG: hypothetical protein J6O00_05390 [Clostridiales bacterium]|nr:hypothetical protein [Clostridiales bacterium]
MKTTDTLKTGPKLKDISIEISYKAYFVMAAVYLVLPVLIFFAGYLRPALAGLFMGLTAFACWWFLRDCDKSPDGTSADTSKFTIVLKPSYIIVVGLLVIFFLFIGGISEFGFGSSDHTMRYAILNDLVKYKWPVIYDFSTQENPIVQAYLGDHTVAFSYYFVFWMVPAVIGKAFGLMAARVALFIWSAIGLFLVAVGASMLYGKASKVLFVGMMLFAGFDVVPYFINEWAGVWTTWERWNPELIVVGNFYQVMNVFNQCIPGWIVTILLIMCVNGRSTGLLGSLMFCYSPWAAIGILPMCICKIITKRGTKVLRNLLSVGNIVAPVVFFIVFASLYTSNTNATDESGFTWTFYPSVLMFLKDYFLFIVVEFLLWFMLIYRNHRRDAMLLTAVGTMLIIPFYKITYANDFLMRGSMAPMFLISLYAVMFVTDYFYKALHGKKFEIVSRLVVLMLLVSAYSSLNLMIYHSIESVRMNMGHEELNVSHDIESFGNIRKEDEIVVINDQFFVYDYEDTIFFKYLARR